MTAIKDARRRSKTLLKRLPWYARLFIRPLLWEYEDSPDSPFCFDCPEGPLCISDVLELDVHGCSQDSPISFFMDSVGGDEKHQRHIRETVRPRFIARLVADFIGHCPSCRTWGYCTKRGALIVFRLHSEDESDLAKEQIGFTRRKLEEAISSGYLPYGVQYAMDSRKLSNLKILFNLWMMRKNCRYRNIKSRCSQKWGFCYGGPHECDKDMAHKDLHICAHCGRRHP
jgi:hypothetical protein